MHRTVITVLMITIFLFHSEVYAKKINVGVLLSLTGSYAASNIDIKNSIDELYKEGKIHPNIKTFYYDVNLIVPGAEINEIKKAILKDDVDIILGPFFPYSFFTSESYFQIQKKFSSTVFIIPFYNERLNQSYKKRRLNNTFIIPEPVDSIFIMLNDFLKSSDFELSIVKKFLGKKQKLTVKQYLYFQKEMSKYLFDAIKIWEQQNGGRVELGAAKYIEKTYIENTMWYATTVPGFRINEEWIKSTTLKEINEILSTYYEMTKNLNVTAESLKTSGVNGCESRPCKKKCCPYYKQHNHECLDKTDCS